ncbi:hypothetical protein IFT68_22700 [Oxalobacteraceae sp. CFBP 13730]|nr:hypothetical protein [Oxalobacteraceae sp. CFBP 13730]
MKFARFFMAAGLVSCIFGASQSIAGGYTPAGVIREFSVWNDINGILIMPSDLINPDNCVRRDQITLQKTHPQYKEIYSMVLAAHISGKKVFFYLEGCAQNFPNVVHMVIQN